VLYNLYSEICVLLHESPVRITRISFSDCFLKHLTLFVFKFTVFFFNDKLITRARIISVFSSSTHLFKKQKRNTCGYVGRVTSLSNCFLPTCYSGAGLLFTSRHCEFRSLLAISVLFPCFCFMFLETFVF